MSETVGKSANPGQLRHRAVCVAATVLLAFAPASSHAKPPEGATAAATAAPTAQTAAIKRNPDEAAAVSIVAATKAKAGDFAMCRELFLQAYRLDPAFLGYLYSAARCAHKGGDLDAAERDYRAFVERAAAEDPMRERADQHLEEIYARRAKQVGAGGKATPGDDGSGKAKVDGDGDRGSGGGGSDGGRVTDVDRPLGGRGIAGLGLIGGGVAAIGGGVVLALMAVSERDALLGELKPSGGNTLVWGQSHQDAAAKADTIDGRVRLGVGLGVVGAVLVGGGVYLWLSRPAEATAWRLLPTPGGVALQAVWR